MIKVTLQEGAKNIFKVIRTEVLKGTSAQGDKLNLPRAHLSLFRA